MPYTVNRWRRRLVDWIVRLQQKVASLLEHTSEAMIIDSVPGPAVKLAKEKSFKSFK